MSTTITVSNAAELNQALAQATGGETILLAAGNYGKLSLNNTQFSSNVTIKSADPNAMASFSEAHLNGASNVTFDTVNFDYTFSSGDYHFQNKFSVTNSSNIAFNNSNFDGDFASGTGTTADGTGYGTGLMITGSSNIDITNTEFSKWWKGAIAINSDGVSFSGNDIHSIRSDGLVFDNVDNILVENNYIHDFGGAAGAGDHRDMIQVQRANGSGSDNIIIRDNVFDMGNGDYTQTIWMGGDGKNISDPNVIHHNVLIEGNVIYNGHLHGISVYGADGITVTKNSVLHVDEKTQTGGIEIPLINVSGDSKNVTITQNITSQILGDNGQPGWTVADNVLIKPSEYDQHFIYQATAQADGYNQYIVKPGSPADSLNAGSDLASNISGSYFDWLINTGSSGSNNQSQTNPGTTPPDTGTTPPDTGTTPPDTGTTPPDTGTTPPDTGEEQQPDTGEEQQPDTGEEQQPDTGEEQQPDTGEEQQPDTGEEQQPDTGEEQQPDTGEEQQPDTGEEQQPDTGEEQQPDTGEEQQPDTGEEQRPDTGEEQQPDTGEEQRPDTGEEEQEPVAALPGNLIDISEQDGRGRIGLLEEYQNSGQICFSVAVARDEGDTGAERLAWNPSNFGLKVNRKGDLVAKVDNNDGGFRDGFKIKDIGLNDGETHQVTLMVDQESDRLQVSVDGVLVLDETETDFDFVGGREKGWFLGDSVDAFAIEDAVQFVDGSLDQYYDLFA